MATKKSNRKRKVPKRMTAQQIKAVSLKADFFRCTLLNCPDRWGGSEEDSLYGISYERLQTCSAEEGVKIITEAFGRESSFSRLLQKLQVIHVSLAHGLRAQLDICSRDFRPNERDLIESNEVVQKLFPDSEQFTLAQKTTLGRLIGARLHMANAQAQMTQNHFQKQLEQYNHENSAIDATIIACRSNILSFIRGHDGPLQLSLEPLMSTTETLLRAEYALMSGLENALHGLYQFCCRTLFLQLRAQDEHGSVMTLLELDPIGPDGNRRPLDQAISLRWHDIQYQIASTQCRIARHKVEASQMRLRIHLLGWRARLKFSGTQLHDLLQESQSVSVSLGRLEFESEHLRRHIWGTQSLGHHYRVQYERLLRSPLLHYLTEREDRARAIKAEPESHT